MPKPLQYKSGSLIYFQGDPAEKVFILQGGKVNLSYQDIETGEDVHDMVSPGEFFGVKSALGRYPREENAMAMQDATILAFTVPEFEALAMANTRIIIKMLKVFSNQLRKIHKQVSSLMEKEEQNPEAGLFGVGEYYLKMKNWGQARYVFSRYLTYYPTGRNAAQAASKLQIAETAMAKMGGSAQGGAGEEYDEQVSSGETQFIASKLAASDFAKSYYDAVSLISQQKYLPAYQAFVNIVQANKDPEYAAKSNFEIGRCLFLMNRYEDCIKHYTKMITQYPKHPDLADTLFLMGQSHEKGGNKDMAKTFYKKILSMSGEGLDGVQIKARRALRDLEI